MGKVIFQRPIKTFINVFNIYSKFCPWKSMFINLCYHTIFIFFYIKDCNATGSVQQCVGMATNLPLVSAVQCEVVKTNCIASDELYTVSSFYKFSTNAMQIHLQLFHLVFCNYQFICILDKLYKFNEHFWFSI